MTKYFAQLKSSGHHYEWCGHHHKSVNAAVDCIFDRGRECGSYVIASEPCAPTRELSTDEEIPYDLALQKKISRRIDEALRRLEKLVA